VASIEYQEYASKEEDGMVGSEGNSPRLAGRRAGRAFADEDANFRVLWSL
jgi:hypothetical protein